VSACKPPKVASVTAIRPDMEPAGDWTDRLITRWTKSGRVPADVAANAIVALRYHPDWAGVVAFDQFQQTIVTLKPPPWGPEEAPPVVKLGAWTDGDSIRLQAWLRREASMPMTLGRDAVDAALIVASEANPVDPPREYLSSLEWDTLRRVGVNGSEADPDGAISWLTRYLGVPDTAYTRWVGRWFLIASVARIYAPGCKVDNALVLEGAQGALKSTSARVLYDPWYSDTPIDLSNKDRFSSIQGVWGYELAEFDAYSKHEAGIIKAFVSSPSDKFRPPYLRRDVIAPRRCVFLATINPGREYLQDETGGRRWWPVRVGSIDIEALKRDRDLLWAEARELYLANEPWYPRTPLEHDSCKVEQADRFSRDAWEEPVRDWLAADTNRIEVTISAILAGPIGLDKARWGRGEQMRAGQVMRGLGYERVRTTAGGAREYIYRKVTPA
jgi:putative DNA primase/helicase